MEVALAVGTLKVAYHLLIVGIKVDQVPNAVRRCIELVRTCHHDLEDLIKLRNESLPMLESKPAILQRINTIIENAHNGLLEVARLVEKLRPEAHDGSSPLMGRLEWIFIDSREFSSQEPLISRQHSSVIAELNFLRQLILLTPLIKDSQDDTDKARTKRPVIAWDNVGLLDEMLGGRKQTLPQAAPTSLPVPISSPSITTTPQSAPIGRVASPTPTLSDPPPPYSSPKPALGFPVPVTSSCASNTNPLIYNVAVPGQGLPVGGSGSNWYAGQVKVSTEKRRTTFDADGMSFLFGDLKVAPKPAATPTTASIPTAQPTASTSLSTKIAASYPWMVPAGTSSTTQTHVQDPTRHDRASTVNNYPQGLAQAAQQAPQQVVHPGPPLQQPSPSQPQSQAPSTHPESQTHPYSQAHGPPVPAKDEPAFEVKPLTTIPQELIHRHDGVKSPPEHPLFAPPPMTISPSTVSTCSVPVITARPAHHQPWVEQQQQATVPSSEVQVQSECCSSCGSARNSLFNVPTGITSRPSSLSLAESFHSSLQSQATYQPMHQNQPQNQAGHIRNGSTDRPRTAHVPVPQSDQYYPVARGWDSPQSNSPQPAALRPRPSTANFQNLAFPDEIGFPHMGYSRYGDTRTPDSGRRYTTPQPTTQMSQIPMVPPVAAQSYHNLQDAWRYPPSTQIQQPAPPQMTQNSVPSSYQGSSSRPSNINPAFQTFATTREHWKPETLTGVGARQPHAQAPYGPSQRHDAQGYPVHASNPNLPPNQFQARGSNLSNNNASQPTETYTRQTATRKDNSAASAKGLEANVAELYGSSALLPGIELEQDHEAGKAHWYVKTHDGMVHSEVHELPSVKFAPDPVELE